MDPIRLVVPPRDVAAGDPRRPGAPGPTGLPVRRTLPERRLAAIGAWCVLEHFGDPHTRPGVLETLAYPEAGLQSVTWPIDGLIRRRDSLGNDLLLQHGRVALGTAGSGMTIADSGVDDPRGGRHARRFLHGVRLAAVLPAAHRHVTPGLQDFEPPTVATPTLRATVLVGALAGPHAATASPGVVHTPLVAADLTLATGMERLALDPSYEHGILLLDGEVSVDGTPLATGDLAYLPVGRERVDLGTLPGCQVLLIGGTPFEEEFLLWWDIAAGSHEEIVAARQAWEDGGEPFGSSPAGTRRASAPALPPVRLRPRRGSLRAR